MRIVIALYGVLAYLLFLATFLYAVGFLGGYLVPKAINDGVVVGALEAILVNVGLISLFALQHSIMARPRFKAMWTRIIPPAAERSTYVLLSSLVLIFMFWQWRPMPEVIYSVEGPGEYVIRAIHFLGWGILLGSSYMINHNQLFGLEQVFNGLRKKEDATMFFTVRGFYKLVRHPLMLGFLVAFWSTPLMTHGYLLFAVVNTIYVLIGLHFEERNLSDEFGQDYEMYKQAVRKLIPIPRLNSFPVKLMRLSENIFNNSGGALATACARIGDRLGIYEVLAKAPDGLTAAELAEETKLAPRMVFEWAMNQAVNKYISYDPSSEKYSMTREQVALFTRDSPINVLGGFQLMCGLVKQEEEIADTFVHGDGRAMSCFHTDVLTGEGRFFQPVFDRRLVSEWIPRVEGLKERLEQGARIADIGTGSGYSTMTMAAAFPNSTFIGYDIYEPSVLKAQEEANRRGLKNCTFETRDAADIPSGFQILATFNCFHDVQHAEQAARHYRKIIEDDGILFVQEPMGGNRPEENFNTAGKILTGTSVLCCTPHGLANNGLGLGTVVPEDRMRNILLGAGFSSFKCVHRETFTRVFDVRP